MEEIAETREIKTTTEVLDTKTLYKGKTKKIEVNKYYDLDGQEIDEGKDVVEYPNEVDFEIVEKKIKYNWLFDEPTIFPAWEIKVDGKRFDKEFELTGYKVLKTKVVLQGCTGAG